MSDIKWVGLVLNKEDGRSVRAAARGLQEPEMPVGGGVLGFL